MSRTTAKQILERQQEEVNHIGSVKQIRKNGQKPSALSPRFVSGRLSRTWGCGSEGERLTGSQKVAGSSPASSILDFQGPSNSLLVTTPGFPRRRLLELQVVP